MPEKRHAEIVGNKGTKTEILSALRHEFGHIDRTPLGRGGMIIGKLKVNAKIAEEIRAWKNAIRNSGGKVDMKFVRYALGTYFQMEPVVAKRIEKRYASQAKKYGSIWTDMMRDTSSKINREEREALVEEHIIPILRRYRDRVRRASRKAQVSTVDDLSNDTRLKMVDILSQDATLRALMGGSAADPRVYPYYRGEAKITPELPGYITYTMTARPEAVVAVDSPTYSIGVWARSEGRCEELSTRVMALLHQRLLLTSAGRRVYTKVINAEDAFSEQPNYCGRRLHVRVGATTV